MGNYHSHNALRMRYVTHELNEKSNNIRFFYLATSDLIRVHHALETLKDVYHINIYRTTYYSPVYQFDNRSTIADKQKATLSVGVQTTVAETTKVTAGLNISASSYATLATSYEKSWSKQLQDTTSETLEIEVNCEAGKRTQVQQKFISFIFFLSPAMRGKGVYEDAVHEDDRNHDNVGKNRLMNEKKDAFLADIAHFRAGISGQYNYDQEIGSLGLHEEVDREYSFAELTSNLLKLKSQLVERYTVLDFHYSTPEFRVVTFDSPVPRVMTS